MNIFCVTIDNTSSNDTTIAYFKKKLLIWGVSSVRSKYVHMRCFAHILNLVVNEGLKDANLVIKRVRKAVKYVRNSPTRLKKIREYSDLVGVECKSSLSLDVPTRWNSTYLVLKTACSYKKSFQVFKEQKFSFRADLGENVHSFEDWEIVKQYMNFL